MKPPAFTYHRPSSVPEAVQMLADLGTEPGGAKVLAGGQSLVPLMSMRLAAPAHLVDLNHVPDLAFVETTEAGVRVGALARHAQVERDPSAATALPLLRQALSQVAHPTIRNRGTTVGSIVHGDPAAEMTAVLALLGGSVDVRGPDGERSITAADLFTGPLMTSLSPTEVAVAARFPALPARSGTAFLEVARRHGDYAVCGVAAIVSLDPDHAVTSARVSLVSAGPVPVVVDLTPAVSGSGGGFADDRVVELLDEAITPEDDIHATASYRRRLAHVLTRRAVASAHDAAAGREGRAA